MDKITAIVIDDEPLAREDLTELLSESQQVSVIDQASNAIEGLKMIHAHKPDVVFLDIEMPQITGIEMLAMLDPDTMPKIVFVTAYDQYAIQAFENNAFDYLLKPIDPKRLEKTLCKLNKQQPKPNLNIAPSYLEQIPCMGNHRIMIVATNEVESAYTGLTGVQVRTAHSELTTQLSLKVLEDKTPLLRCHRQYLINVKRIKEISLLENGLAEIITQTGFIVPISRRYLKAVKEQLGII
jgi:two-component system LytT family response regulator